MTVIGHIAKASRAFTLELGKREKGEVVKCWGRKLTSTISSPSLSYGKSIYLCLGDWCQSTTPREWHKLHLSSDKDKCKEEEEEKGEHLLRIPAPERRESYLAFHHDERHREQGEKPPPPMLPLITKLEVSEDNHCGSGCAVVGSTIYDIGGRRSTSWSHNVTYFDASHPEGRWKRGPHTICGREDAAVVALNGKIYVFSGGGNPHIWAEFLDTKLIGLEEEGEVGWNYLQDHSGPLGFDDLFAVALDDDKYSGKILVGSKRTGAICLYDVTCAVWETLAISVDFRFLISNQVVVETTIYWIDLLDKHLCAYDIVQRTKYSTPILDFKISELLENFIVCPNPDLLRLMHLTDDDFLYSGLTKITFIAPKFEFIQHQSWMLMSCAAICIALITQLRSYIVYLCSPACRVSMMLLLLLLLLLLLMMMANDMDMNVEDG